MPVYHFATYADVLEGWAIAADSAEHARNLIGDDIHGDWTERAVRLEVEPLERRDEFAVDVDDVVMIDEITPANRAWRDVHRDEIEHSLKQNIAAIAGDFHAHRLCDAFYDRFGRLIDGFVGQYELCIAMAEALTDWEVANGLGDAYENAGVPWIEVVEDFVDTVLTTATETGDLPDPREILPSIQVLAGRSAP